MTWASPLACRVVIKRLPSDPKRYTLVILSAGGDEFPSVAFDLVEDTFANLALRCEVLGWAAAWCACASWYSANAKVWAAIRVSQH